VSEERERESVCVCVFALNSTLNFDVKLIISKHLLKDYKLSATLISKHQDLIKNFVW
jgi:hypothetical protein